jgi:oxalate decarboxylase family bicupin protein
LHTIQCVPLFPQLLPPNNKQKEILSKNFDLPLSAWDNIPAGELFIFPGTKASADISTQNVVGSAGLVPIAQSYTYHLSQKANDHETAGGSVKVIDPTIFPIASKFSAAVVTVKPGALREIHWHTTSDEWNFFVAGSARIGIYAAQGNARTFDYVSFARVRFEERDC